MTHLKTSAIPDTAAAPRFSSAIQDFAQSGMFQRLFDEGMALVEHTASYLDGPGRQASRTMSREMALTYAGESMRLTTRLMQVASWLLLQKAVREYEISPEQAGDEKYRLGAQDICRGHPLELTHRLPPELVDLLIASESIYDRVDRLDRALFLGEPIRNGTACLSDQRERLRAAFGGA